MFRQKASNGNIVDRDEIKLASTRERYQIASEQNYGGTGLSKLLGKALTCGLLFASEVEWREGEPNLPFGG